jgi:hypothetical protein
VSNLRWQHRELLEQLTQVEADLAHIEAAEEAKARQRVMALAASRTRTFRDGTPKDKAGHKEIARRYAWQASKNGKSIPRPKQGETGSSKLIAMIRLREIESLCSGRFGALLPDDPAGRCFIEIAANHILGIGGDHRHMLAWIRLWAPWMHPVEAAAIARKAIETPIKYCADTLGWRLGLTGDERHELGITTIGAVGVPKERRAEFRKLKARLRAQTRRRQAGAQLRVLYEHNSLAWRKPWVALGISRSTWYRRGKPPLPGESISRRRGSGVTFPDAPDAPADPLIAPEKAPEIGVTSTTDAIETSPYAAGNFDIGVYAGVSSPARDGPDARLAPHHCLSLPRVGPCAPRLGEGLHVPTPSSVLDPDQSENG